MATQKRKSTSAKTDSTKPSDAKKTRVSPEPGRRAKRTTSKTPKAQLEAVHEVECQVVKVQPVKRQPRRLASDEIEVVREAFETGVDFANAIFDIIDLFRR